MRLIVDRIERTVAVCEKDDGTFVEIEIESLPEGTEEGSVLNAEDGKFELNEQERSSREKRISALMDSLFSE